MYEIVLVTSNTAEIQWMDPFEAALDREDPLRLTGQIFGTESLKQVREILEHFPCASNEPGCFAHQQAR